MNSNDNNLETYNLPPIKQMQLALKFHKAKLHIYDPKSSQSPQKKNTLNNPIYRFATQCKQIKGFLHHRSRTEQSPNRKDQILCASQTRLSVWDLHSDRLQQKKNSNKKHERKNISFEIKAQKNQSQYMTIMRHKRKFQKQHYIHKYAPKNIQQIQVNKLQLNVSPKHENILKIGKSPVVNNKICLKLGYAATFSQRFKEFKQSLGSIQNQNLNFIFQQKQNFLQYTLNTTDLVSKRSQSLFVKSFVKKTQKKPDFGQNLQAWTDRSHKDDGLQIDGAQINNKSQRPKSKGHRKRQTKSFAQ